MFLTLMCCGSDDSDGSDRDRKSLLLFISKPKSQWLLFIMNQDVTSTNAHLIFFARFVVASNYVSRFGHNLHNWLPGTHCSWQMEVSGQNH